MKKILFTLLIAGIWTQSNSQTTKPSASKATAKRTISKTGLTKPTVAVTPSQPLQPRETATDRYLNGPTRKSAAGNTTAGTAPAVKTGDTSPFASGIYAGNNAGKTFDTVQSSVNNTARTAGSAVAAAGNDTAINQNTVLSNGGITTNSGAVDRSGQSQFGQTNWGNGRSTVGESQWTVPPPITASFNKEFPAAGNAVWTRNSTDTSLFSARYKSGATWITSNYNATGERLDMRTEVPLLQSPRPVNAYLVKQPDGFKAVSIYKLQVQGKPDVYEIQTDAGKTIYVNNDGLEVNY